MRVKTGLLKIAVAGLLALCSSALFAATYTVDPNGTGDCPTIQAAINAAVDEDTITVLPGTYYENINFNGKNIILTSTDPNNSDIVASTIIDGQQVGSVVRFSGSENNSCTLQGFTITGGNGHVPPGYIDKLGGGICGGDIHNQTKASIVSCIITGNTADTGGGLCYCGGTISNCTISDNTGKWGGGVAWCHGLISNCVISGNSAVHLGGGFYSCTGTIKNCTINDNVGIPPYGDGGGISSCISGTGTVENCLITSNSARFGGGINRYYDTIKNCTIVNNTASVQGGGLEYCVGVISKCTIIGNVSKGVGGGLSNCDGIISNCVISGNIADQRGGGLWDCDDAIRNCTIFGNEGGERGGGMDDCHGSITNCIIWNNNAETGKQIFYSSMPTYCCIQDWSEGGIYNISSNPGFVDVSSGDPNDWDLHLLLDSSCIDAGTNSPPGGLPPTDIEENARPYDSDGDGNSTADIGAYEFIALKVPQMYSSIQMAIDAANNRNTVIVSPGTYYENINFNGKDIILTSINPNDQDVVAATIIDGNDLGCVVTFSGSERSTCELRGLTITNGNHSLGGGIRGNHTKATIVKCIISGNMAHHGGGMYNCDGAIAHCVVENNNADGYGGGLDDCQGLIKNCKIAGNTAEWGGGLSSCDGTIVNCEIIENSAYYGGGLSYCYGSINNCIIVRNNAEGILLPPYDEPYGGVGGGLYNCGNVNIGAITNCTIARNESSAPYGAEGGIVYSCGRITNCIIWDNIAFPNEGQVSGGLTPEYSCIQYWTEGGTGNITDNPFFVDSDNGEYHLKSEYGRWDSSLTQWIYDNVTSPCIDAGDPADMGWQGELWPHGGRINMGAYGGTAQASMSPNPVGNPADLNHDNAVDLADWSLWSYDWLAERTLLDSDFDRDNDVDPNDMGIFIENWLWAE
jgi:hypothetical protein